MDIIEKYFLLLNLLLIPVLYVVVACLFYFIFHIWKYKKFSPHKIQAGDIKRSQLIRELTYSIVSLILFSATGLLVYFLFKKGYTNIYFNVSKHGWFYFFFSILLMMFFHDMYFYWTHRLLHLPGWYQKIHIIHHLSSSPSPFTSLAFHPVEAIVQAAVLPLMLIIIPSHPVAVMLFSLHMIYKNVRGHTGFEFTTAAYRQSKWNGWLSYTVHHNNHHLHCHDNYGLYFTFWDKLMKTFRKEA
jgi:sterol desaturase/sphingolipid hydroxylase (fatty acid hydroxylase superfamily)